MQAYIDIAVVLELLPWLPMESCSLVVDDKLPSPTLDKSCVSTSYSGLSIKVVCDTRAQCSNLSSLFSSNVCPRLTWAIIAWMLLKIPFLGHLNADLTSQVLINLY